jgi:putative hydrolase of HD superfamily
MRKSNKKDRDVVSIVNFLFEIGTMRKLLRMHRQALLTDDMSDNIATHSYRVAIISWFLAKGERVDVYKTIMMSLLHDVAEIRSNDHNWIHKKYVKIFEDEISHEQLGSLPYPDMKQLIEEYNARKSPEAILAKEADLLDQILLLREYEMAGNMEAKVWLHGKGDVKGSPHMKRIKSKTGKKIGLALFKTSPSEWWSHIWTTNNR